MPSIFEDMAQKATKTSQVVAQIMIDLGSDNEDTVLKAVKKTRSKGTEQIIPTLFKTFTETGSERVKKEITELLSELKSSQVVEALIDQLSLEDESGRRLALTAIWSSGLDANDFVDEIVQAAIRGSFMESFEALTIIENLEPPFEEEVILNSQLMLKQYFTEERTTEKDDVLRTITALINNINAQLQ